MILITTAGKVGAEAARLLAQREEPARVLVRDPEKATALAQAGADLAVGDLDVPATIDAAMRGISAIVLVSPAIPAQELNVVASAAGADVGHVVKITSKASADSPIARRRDQTEIENGLIASGLGYTLLRNNAYMQNFLMLAPAIAKTGSFGSSAGEGRVGMVDTRDVAAVAAQIAASPAAHRGKTYWPTGPKSPSYADAAVVLSKVLGRPVTFHPLTFEEQKQARAGGAIINFSSSVTKLAPPAYAACAATKGAVEAMTLIVARELRGRDFSRVGFRRRSTWGGSRCRSAPGCPGSSAGHRCAKQGRRRPRQDRHFVHVIRRLRPGSRTTPSTAERMTMLISGVSG